VVWCGVVVECTFSYGEMVRVSKRRYGCGGRVGVVYVVAGVVVSAVVYPPFSNASSRTHQVGWGLSGIYLDGRDSLRRSVLLGPCNSLGARKKKKINV